MYGAVPYAKKQVMHLEADISDLKADFGWKPEIDFREGIRAILAEEQAGPANKGAAAR